MLFIGILLKIRKLAASDREREKEDKEEKNENREKGAENEEWYKV